MKIHKVLQRGGWWFALCCHRILVEPLLATKDNTQVTCKRCLKILAKER